MLLVFFAGVEDGITVAAEDVEIARFVGVHVASSVGNEFAKALGDHLAAGRGIDTLLLRAAKHVSVGLRRGGSRLDCGAAGDLDVGEVPNGLAEAEAKSGTKRIIVGAGRKHPNEFKGTGKAVLFHNELDDGVITADFLEGGGSNALVAFSLFRDDLATVDGFHRAGVGEGGHNGGACHSKTALRDRVHGDGAADAGGIDEGPVAKELFEESVEQL